MSSIDKFLQDITKVEYKRQQDTSTVQDLSLPITSISVKKPNIQNAENSQSSVCQILQELIKEKSSSVTVTNNSNVSGDGLHQSRLESLETLNSHLDKIVSSKDFLRHELRKQTAAGMSLPIDFKYVRSLTETTRLLTESALRISDSSKLNDIANTESWDDFMGIAKNVEMSLRQAERDLNFAAGDFAQLSNIHCS